MLRTHKQTNSNFIHIHIVAIYEFRSNSYFVPYNLTIHGGVGGRLEGLNLTKPSKKLVKSLTIIAFIGRVKSYYLQFNSNIQTISIKSVAQKWKRKWRWKKWEKASQFSSDSEFSPLALKKIITHTFPKLLVIPFYWTNFGKCDFWSFLLQ